MKTVSLSCPYLKDICFLNVAFFSSINLQWEFREK